jgi:hypothetical protein
MITDKAKSSEIEKVLQELHHRYSGCAGLDELVREIRAKKLSIAAQVVEPVADGKIGRGDFRDAIRPIIEQLFQTRLGPLPQTGTNFEQNWDAAALATDFNCLQARAAQPLVQLDATALKFFPGVGEGIRRAVHGDFAALPTHPTWPEILCLAVAIDGYKVIKTLTHEHIESFHKEKEAQFRKEGRWTGSILELWVVLFNYNRINHWNTGSGFGEGEPFRLLTESAYQALRAKLMNPEELSKVEFITSV